MLLSIAIYATDTCNRKLGRALSGPREEGQVRTHKTDLADRPFSRFTFRAAIDDDKQTVGALHLVRSVEEEVVWLPSLHFTPESASNDRSRFRSSKHWFDHADRAFAITHQGEMLVVWPVEVTDD